MIWRIGSLINSSRLWRIWQRVADDSSTPCRIFSTHAMSTTAGWRGPNIIYNLTRIQPAKAAHRLPFPPSSKVPHERRGSSFRPRFTHVLKSETAGYFRVVAVSGLDAPVGFWFRHSPNEHVVHWLSLTAVLVKLGSHSRRPVSPFIETISCQACLFSTLCTAVCHREMLRSVSRI